MVNKERVSELVIALRSGAWPQTTGWLRKIIIDDGGSDVRAGFCCLGVACEIALTYGVGHRVDSLYYSGPEDVSGQVGSRYQLPAAAIEWYGFSNSNPLIKILCREIPANHHSGWCEDCRAEGGVHRNEECDNLIVVAATDANDEMGLDFNQIADGFERMYLEGE
jgi:hypothetical protein